MLGKKNTSVNKAVWSLLGRYVPQMLQILSTIIIARLVLPSDFGEVAIVSTFIQIASVLVSSGFAEALIFRVKNSNTLYSTVFYTNILISFILYVFLFIFSIKIAEFYSIERLGILIKIVGLNIIIYSFTYIQRVLYSINLNFKTPALITLIASIVGSVFGLSLAFNNFGVWALVLQTLSINMIQLVLFWILSNWRPRLSFSKKQLIEILPYSSKILFNNIIQVIYDNIYSLVLGKVYSSKILGYYNRMQSIVFFTTTNFVYALESVFFPTLSRRKDNINHIRDSYELLLRLITFISFPILIIMISLAKPLILVILTDKWIESLMILKLLSVASLFIPISYINNSFLKIINKPQLIFKTGVIKKTIGVIILFVSIRFDIETVCYGIILYYFIDTTISMFCTHVFLRVNIYKQIRFMLSNIMLNILLYLVIVYVSTLFHNNFMKILFGLLIGGAFYFLTSIILKTKEFSLLRNLLIKER